MKKKITILAFSVVGGAMFSAFTVLQSTGMSTYSGSPADAASCSDCHSGGSTTPGLTITPSPALGAGNTYQPNTTYTFTITGSGYTKYGFDFEVINSLSTSATSVGDFGTLGSAPSGEAVYAPNSGGWPHGYHDITHTTPRSGAFFVVWTAPASGTGYLYCALLGVNNNGSTSGDKAAYQNITLTPASSTSLAENNTSGNFNLVVFPNPATSEVRLAYKLEEPSLVSIKLYNIAGQNVYELVNDREDRGPQSKNITLPAEIDKGLYFVKLTINGHETTKHLMIN